MKKVLTLLIMIALLTGGCTLKSYKEDAKLIAAEVERHVSAQNQPTQPALDPTPSPTVIIELPAPTPKPAETPMPFPEPIPTPTPEHDQTESATKINLPLITAPAEPELPYITSPTEPELPFITAPVEPQIVAPIPEPTSTPTPTPIPLQTPEPSSQPIEPSVAPSAEPTQDGYAECSCGSTLSPDELVAHMKAHALNGESHSYRAY